MSKHDAGFCPVCECADLEYGEKNIDGDTMTYDWNCPVCKSDGREVYYIDFAEHEITYKGKVPKRYK